MLLHATLTAQVLNPDQTRCSHKRIWGVVLAIPDFPILLCSHDFLSL